MEPTKHPLPRSIQKSLNIKFNGMQVGMGMSFPLYTDLLTGSTFTVGVNELVCDALKRNRAKWKVK